MEARELGEIDSRKASDSNCANAVEQSIDKGHRIFAIRSVEYRGCYEGCECEEKNMDTTKVSFDTCHTTRLTGKSLENHRNEAKSE